MKNKIWDSFDKAVVDIPDGASVLMFSWGPAGTPQNLMRALYDKGAKNLTVISHNFVPGWFEKEEYFTPYYLVRQVKKLITAWPRPLGATIVPVETEELVKRGELELELTSHGTLAERIRAGGSGLGGFYSPVGVGTILEQGKEKKIIDGREYVLEKAIRADFGFVRAYKADKRGNLVYRGSGRACNPIIAMASDITIAEVDEIVEIGELDPEVIVTPGIFVDRIIKVPEGAIGSYKQRDELRCKYFTKAARLIRD